MKSSLLIWHIVHIVKSTVKISSIFVAFLENTNFKMQPQNMASLIVLQLSNVVEYTYAL